VFSNHDVVRHASRYALPAGTDLKAWLLSDGTQPEPDDERGLRRARAVTLLALALPGSMYLYQGEELGLAEVADLPVEALQDPVWTRSQHTEKGRDGCRVPLPWTSTGPSFGFGSDGAHLPQPSWFADVAADVQDGREDSTLTFYRRAMAERRRLQTTESLTWSDDVPADVVRFTRPGGWTSITNFGDTPVSLPPGRLVVASSPVHGDRLPGETTAWIQQDAQL
jgi:alpha-glucosidase